MAAGNKQSGVTRPLHIWNISSVALHSDWLEYSFERHFLGVATALERGVKLGILLVFYRGVITLFFNQIPGERHGTMACVIECCLFTNIQ